MTGVRRRQSIVCSQYFNNERYETEKYDAQLQLYEKASLKTTTSLALLNLGQNTIFSVGITAVMMMAARNIMDGDGIIFCFLALLLLVPI